MRYYGMTNDMSRTLSPDIEEKPAVSAVPKTQNPQTAPIQTENRTFNRPDNQTGIYKGQVAQNVTSVRDWLDEQPPAVLPPGMDPYENSTIYEYPGGQIPVMPGGNQSGQSCQIRTDFSLHLCQHIGSYAYIQLSDGMEKRGIIESVGRNFITLSEGPNHIMCPLSAVTAISLTKPTR